MIPRIFIAFILWESAFSYPQFIRIPEIKNSAPPAEVNSLTEHKQYPRSIGTKPTSYNNIEDTIKEVETMLKINPTLPRLTRGEIMDLIENITKNDMAKGKLSNEDQDLKGRDPKAIMVVMPYTSNINDKNMHELFTKPPVTHIVGNEPSADSSNQKQIGVNNDLGNQQPPVNEESFNDLIQHTPKFRSTSTQISIISTTTNAPTVQTKQRRRRPQYPSTQQSTSSTEVPVTTHHPRLRGRRPGRRRPTTTEKHPNHRYPDEEFTESPNKFSSLPSDGIQIIEAPKFDPNADDLIMQENQRNNVYMNQDVAASSGKGTERQPLPTVVNPIEKSTTVLPLPNIIEATSSDVASDISMQVPPQKNIQLTKESAAKDDEDKLKQMLASLGLNTPGTTTTTTTAAPDISNVVDNLSPEMKDLLMNFGLIPNPEDNPSTQRTPSATPSTTPSVPDSFNPEKAEVKPESYSSFKPLPDDDLSRYEMEELLARFGLGGVRKRKSLPKKEQDMTFEAVPDQYKGVLENIGLIDREGKMIRAEPLVKTQEKQHVFSPGDSEYASSEEMDKLNKLLEFVKKLEKLNRTVTDEDVQQMDVENLKELVASLNKEKMVPLDEQNAPNPLNFDHSLDKNEVKRQKNATTTSNPKAEVENITLSVNTNAESDTPNIKDLEASFGGQVDANPATEPPVPETTKSTGFYYLVDWNTFLDIDDQKGKRVNLRFQPTVGDPKKFYSVSVP